MSSDFSRRSRFFHPESLMMSHGYDPKLSEGSLKCPIFQTSTFVFNSAQQGKDFFALAYGKRAAEPGEELGLIYSRLNNPDVQILEERLALWDKAASCAVFESGMAAISTVFWRISNQVMPCCTVAQCMEEPIILSIKYCQSTASKSSRFLPHTLMMI